MTLQLRYHTVPFLEVRDLALTTVLDPDSLPGAGDVELRVRIADTLAAEIQLRGNYPLAGVSFGVDTYVGVDLAANGILVRLRPQITYDRMGAPHLEFRLVRVQGMRQLMPFDTVDEPSETADLNIKFSTQLSRGSSSSSGSASWSSV